MLYLLVGKKPLYTNLTTSALTEKKWSKWQSWQKQQRFHRRELKAVASKLTCHNFIQHKENREPLEKSQLQLWPRVWMWLSAVGNNPEDGVVCLRTLNTLKEFCIYFTSPYSGKKNYIKRTMMVLFITVNTVKIYLCTNVTTITWFTEELHLSWQLDIDFYLPLHQINLPGYWCNSVLCPFLFVIRPSKRHLVCVYRAAD